MMSAPERYMIDTALREAAKSPCRSKRGVALFNMRNGAFRGSGHNGPPARLPCPGREVCAGTCGKRSVHAEVRALRAAEVYSRNHDMTDVDLIHVELAPNCGVVACGGPSCWQCAREILDVGFVLGVWLYEALPREPCYGGWGGSIGHRYMDGEREVLCPICGGDGFKGPIVGVWRRRSAEEFYATTLHNCGMSP